MVKNLPGSSGDLRDVGSIPGLGRSPGGGHGYPLQYSCKENPHGQRSLVGSDHRVAKSRTRLSDLACMHTGDIRVSNTYVKVSCILRKKDKQLNVP